MAQHDSYVSQRLTALRLQKGVSEYRMSYDLGHSRGYINNISSGKSMPSLTELFAICDYFEITVSDFFDTNNEYPKLQREAMKIFGELSKEDLILVISIMRRLQNT